MSEAAASTNAIPIGHPLNRGLLLAGMCGYFVLALAIPAAFDGSGLTFGIGCVIVVAAAATAGTGGGRRPGERRIEP